MSERRSPGLRPGSQECLPPEIERLLADLVADGFALYCCGPRAAPLALVAACQWEDFVDLATIRCFDRVITAVTRRCSRGASARAGGRPGC